jgi:PAS domain-containing protein
METTKRSQAENSLYELDLCLLNGEKRSIIVTAVPQIDPEKGFTGTYGVFRDITGNKRAEEDHRRIEARFHSTFDLPLVGFAITSLGKGWLEINDAFLKMLECLAIRNRNS